MSILVLSYDNKRCYPPVNLVLSSLPLPLPLRKDIFVTHHICLCNYREKCNRVP